MSSYELVIDCAPGSTRPNDILKELAEGLGLTEEDFTVTSKSFGSWTFSIDGENANKCRENIIYIKDFLTSAYNCGRIRYAEW